MFEPFSFSYLDAVTAAMVSGLDSSGSEVSKGSKPPDMLKAITKPFTKLVVQMDNKVGIPITYLLPQFAKLLNFTDRFFKAGH